MFKALLIKEWKEKALIAVFGLGLMAALLAAFIAFGDNRDLRELIPVGFMIIFFPFIALMLGAGAFESEFRNGAWAYLLSRPVRKETIWLAKLFALLALMAGFWLLFLGLIAAVPGLGKVVGGFKLGGMLEGGLEFFPLILLSSLFYFSVAFALSILSDKLFSLVFGSFFIGFALQALLTFISFQAEGRGYLSAGGLFPWLDAYRLALVLSSLAFLGASLITFKKADFSQPKKKIRALGTSAALFLALAWLLAAAWPALRPRPEEELSSGIEVVEGQAFFATTRAIYRFDVAGGEVKRLTRGWHDLSDFVIGGRKVLYSLYREKDSESVLRIMNMDGTGKRSLLGDGQGEPSLLEFSFNFGLSPDGTTAVILGEDVEGPLRHRTYKKSLWSIRTDGTELKRLPALDPALAGNGKDYLLLRILAWSVSSDRLLLVARPEGGEASLWTYDPATGAQARLLGAERLGWGAVSPRGDAIMVTRQLEVQGPVELFLLDIANGQKMPVMSIKSPRAFIWTFWNAAWSPTGDFIAFLVRKSWGVNSMEVFSRPEGRLFKHENLPAEELLPQEPSSLAPSIAWIGEGMKLLLGVPKERCLKILGADLAVEKKVSMPLALGKEFHVWAAGDTALVQDFTNEAVWRLDLKTESWKKVW